MPKRAGYEFPHAPPLTRGETFALLLEMSRALLVLLMLTGCGGEAPGVLPHELDGCDWYEAPDSLKSLAPDAGTCAKLHTDSGDWLFTVGRAEVCDAPVDSSSCVVLMPGEVPVAYTVPHSDDMTLNLERADLDAGGGCPVACD
jgi:hypothetical protein